MAIKKYLKYLWFYDTTAFLEQVFKRFRPVHLDRSRSKKIREPGQRIRISGLLLTLTMTLFDLYGNLPDNRDVFNPIIISVLKIQLTFVFFFNRCMQLHINSLRSEWSQIDFQTSLNYSKNDFLSIFQ